MVSAGSTDVGDVTWVCPTVQMVAVTTAAGTPGHSWHFVAFNNTSVAHKGTMYAAQVLAGTAVDLFEDPELCKKADEEHKRRLGGATYKCPIPEDVMPRAINDL